MCAAFDGPRPVSARMSPTLPCRPPPTRLQFRRADAGGRAGAAPAGARGAGPPGTSHRRPSSGPRRPQAPPGRLNGTRSPAAGGARPADRDTGAPVGGSSGRRPTCSVPRHRAALLVVATPAARRAKRGRRHLACDGLLRGRPRHVARRAPGARGLSARAGVRLAGEGASGNSTGCLAYSLSGHPRTGATEEPAQDRDDPNPARERAPAVSGC